MPDDAPLLVELWRETWTSTYGPSLGKATLNRMLEGLREGAGLLLPEGGERGYCLVSGDSIVGSAIFAERGVTAYLWGMYVLPSRQRAGAGSQLLAAVASGIRASERLEVRVLGSSRAAETFYRKSGFRRVGAESTAILAGIELGTLVMAAEVLALQRTLGRQISRDH